MYQYQELSSRDNHIRCLILEPGEDDAPLVGRLEEIELTGANDLNPFRAISYVWGEDNKTQSITLDGKLLEITTSLRDSLWQARDAHRAAALWADGICINQDDEKEKSRQVALMGRIYETSKCTLICLGLNADDRQHASDVVELVADVEAFMHEVFEEPEFYDEWDVFPYPFEDDALFSELSWYSWSLLVQHPWFRRGLLRIERFLRRRIRILKPMLTSMGISNLHDAPYNDLHSKEARTFIPYHLRHRLEPMPALEILNRAKRLELGDPKDRIYAFMALRTLDKAMPAVQPDYGKDVSHLDVYQDFAIKYLEKTSDLDILRFVEHEEGESSPSSVAIAGARVRSIASWVPHWDCGSFNSTWSDASDRKLTEGEDDNSKEYSISTVEGSPILRVRAIVFDLVKYVSETIEYHAAVDGREAVTQVVRLWRNLAPQLEKYPGPHRGNRGLAFLVALNMDNGQGDLEEHYRSQCDFARLLESDQPSCPAHAYLQDPAARQVSKFANYMSSNRRFVLLGRGYNGIAPNMAREGDLCAMIFGTRTPFILRMVPGEQAQYRVIGSAYVQSKECHLDSESPCFLSEHEDCDDWKDWGLQTEDITLV
ncbi:hypothetical protein Daus18300_008533 [Diaporthe australafricana]|uniref:Heterokaryon incompatibility domain-containing protein n=1 Tax=Diaporthe australafricana TaxID=127596 RepID=A0ABR3WID3_9PEZI